MKLKTKPKQSLENETEIVAVSDDFVPEYHSDDAACCDLVANIPIDQMGKDQILIPYRQIVSVDCGFSMAVPKGFKAEIMVRSGHAKKGLIVINAPGQVDSDFRGAVQVLVSNIGHEIIQIKNKERFAQMALVPVHRFKFKKVEELKETKRNKGGFGSSGIKV